jgi:hypothetical protein
MPTPVLGAGTARVLSFLRGARKFSENFGQQILWLQAGKKPIIIVCRADSQSERLLAYSITDEKYSSF